MTSDPPAWLAPTSLEEALQLRAKYGDEATVVAGGTFVGILINQRFLAPTTLLSLRRVPGLNLVEANGEDRDGAQSLRLGAMTTHRAVERSAVVRRGWPALAHAFSLVASPRVRNQATVGGVLADADYASDPPAMLTALGAKAVAWSLQGQRPIPIDELITGYYQTSLRPDELLVEVRVPSGIERATYRKFRSRSTEDRPCVAVAAALVRDQGSHEGDGHGEVQGIHGEPKGTHREPLRAHASHALRLRVVVGAVADRPQYFPDICALAGTATSLDGELATEIAQRYAAAIDPISDSRGSADYRRRVIAVEVRRALEEVVCNTPLQP